jgi:hypothetical protein
MFSARLKAFAQETGAGPDKHVILVLDGAGRRVARMHKIVTEEIQ